MWNLKKTSVLVICLGLCFLGIASGEDKEKRVKLKDLPQAVQKTVQEQSQGATVKGFSKEIEQGKTYYEAEMTVNGHSKDILIDPQGNVVEIEEEVAMASLPDAVKNGIERQAGKGKVLKVESITKGGAIAMYEAVVQKGGKKSEIQIGPDGNLMPKEK